MSDDGSRQSGAVWPRPRFHFLVRWDDTEIQFQEVSGLDTNTDPIEYRSGNAKLFSPVRMPGMNKPSNITMKKGVCAKGNAIFDWLAGIRMNTITRKTLTISLTDEAGKPTMVWKVANAFPVKVTGTDLKAEGNEVAIESIEIAHEGLTIENG